ncbi:hypothetical protein C8R45DRAFT_941106 [Mycena sanguinolenta]|nr:hypothetical protein C8R45DRAFT_941106 [Mycena sanguinolenta]
MHKEDRKAAFVPLKTFVSRGAAMPYGCIKRISDWISIAPRRTLRSGMEFSALDLALGRAIMPPVHFNFGEALQERLAVEAVSGPPDGDQPHSAEEPAHDHNRPPDDHLHHHDSPDNDLPTASHPDSLPSPPNSSLTAGERSKLKSKARRKRKRLEARYILAAQEADFQLPEAMDSPELGSGLGGALYTQEAVDALTGTSGFMYIGWLGQLTIPLVDRQRHVCGVLGGAPHDACAWKGVTDGAFALLEERRHRIRLPEDQLHHWHAHEQEAFPALACGWSHSGGQTKLGELCQNVANTRLTDELLAHDFFCCIALFANMLFYLWAPLLFAFYSSQMALLSGWKPSIRPNFVGSVFAACTFNFGPGAICAPHLDFANLAWGWCAITALGDFDPDVSGHLILWDLRLVIYFPLGSTILLPSAIVRHSNVPIHGHERRCSFVQYTAGGLFCWVRNGFKTDEVWIAGASRAEKAERVAEDKM